MAHHVRLSRASTVATPDPTAGDDGPLGIMFGSGVPDPAVYPAEALARETQRVLLDRSIDLGYSRFGGQPRLRAGVAALLHGRSSVQISPEDVVISAGASGALQLTVAALVDPGDVVVTEMFTYPAAVKMFRHQGAEVVTVPTDADGMDADALAAILSGLAASGRIVKAVYTIAPFQSPTTARLTPERAAKLVEVVDRYDTLLLIDDTYGEIDFDGPSSVSLPPILFESGRSVHLGSFSKTLAPALRLGWVAGNSEVVGAINSMRTDIGVSLILQESVASLIASGEYAEHLSQVSGHYRSKRDILIEALQQHCAEHATWTSPHGSFFLWLTTDVSVAALGAHARREGVGYIPGSTFAVDGRAPHTLRLAYGFLATDVLAEGAARLGRALKLAAAG